MRDHPLTVYTPESPLRQPAKFVRDMITDLLASRELAWRLFLRDLSGLLLKIFSAWDSLNFTILGTDPFTGGGTP